MWPNMNPAKAFGTAKCAMSDKTCFLTIGNQYVIFDLDPTALSPTEAFFDYLVLNDRNEYIWVNQNYFTEYTARR